MNFLIVIQCPVERELFLLFDPSFKEGGFLLFGEVFVQNIDNFILLCFNKGIYKRLVHCTEFVFCDQYYSVEEY